MSEKEVFISFPDFLRRGGESWRTGGLIASLSEKFGTSRSSVREDLWPTLLAVHNSSLGGSEEDFSVAKKIGLSAEEHLAVHGIPKSSKSAKGILEAFGDEGVSEDGGIVVAKPNEPVVDNDTQPTLDRFG